MRNHYNNFSYTQAAIHAPLMFPTDALMAGAMANDSGKFSDTVHFAIVAGLTTVGAVLGVASLLAYPISVPVALLVDTVKGYRHEQKYKKLTYDNHEMPKSFKSNTSEAALELSPSNNLSNTEDTADQMLKNNNVNSQYNSTNRLVAFRFNDLLQSNNNSNSNESQNFTEQSLNVRLT